MTEPLTEPLSIGRFRVMRRLGQGAYATVWLAHDDQLDAPVAVKVLAENWAGDPDISARFVDEARMLRQLDDPHVVTVYEVDRLPDGRSCLVMAFADRGTLFERMAARIKARRPFTVSEAVQLSLELAECLDAIHGLGVVHRDLKPSNVLFRHRRDGEQMQLADFGIARRIADFGQQTIIAGTPHYMAPEQGNPDQAATVDHRSDLYSAGVIFFELLAGAPPFASPPPASNPSDPPRLVTLRPDVPASLERVIRRSLAFEPDRRWQTAREWAAAISAATSESIVGPDESPSTTFVGDVERLLSELRDRQASESLRAFGESCVERLRAPCRIAVTWTPSADEVISAIDVTKANVADVEVAVAGRAGHGSSGRVDAMLIVGTDESDPGLPDLIAAARIVELSPSIQVTIALTRALDEAGLARDRVGRVVQLPETPTVGDLTAALAATFEEVRERYRVLRAAAMTRALETLAARTPLPSDEREELQDRLEELVVRGHEVAELRALELLRAGRARVSPELALEAERLLGSAGVAGSLGISMSADRAEAHRVAEEGVARWRAIANTPAAPRDVADLANVVARFYERVWAATQPGD